MATAGLRWWPSLTTFVTNHNQAELQSQNMAKDKKSKKDKKKSKKPAPEDNVANEAATVEVPDEESQPVVEEEQPVAIKDDQEAPQDEEPAPEQKKKKKERGKVCQFILNLFTSYIGLAIILMAYTILGAVWFSSLEKPLEEELHQEMLKEHQKVNNSLRYLVDFLADIHYNKYKTYDNCSGFIKDPFYKAPGSYGEACHTGSYKLIRKSHFCKCVNTYRERYEKIVSISLNFGGFVSLG